MTTYKPQGKWYVTSERKVYFADTDAAGVVHHAQYIRWFEAGRIDMLDDLGCPYVVFHKDSKGLVPVTIDISYKKPLVFGDTFKVESRFVSFQRASVVVEARIVSDKGVHTQCEVKLASMDEAQWKITPLPDYFLKAAIANNA